MHRYLLLLFFIVTTCALHAQETFYIQGRVFSADSLKEIPDVHIISKLNRRGTISLPDGTFIVKSAPNDSLMFTMMGFDRKIVTVTEKMLQEGERISVLMRRDTILMQEVIVRSFYDYQTFKYLIVNMKPLKPVNLESMESELQTSLEEVRSFPASASGPVQALYNHFNEMARLQRRMEHNRQLYNEQLILEGKIEDTIPALPQHLIERKVK